MKGDDHMKNEGTFIDRETTTFDTGDISITDTFMKEDGTLVFHTYNLTSDKKSHSHAVVDENGNAGKGHVEDKRPWHELDRTLSLHWLSLLSENELEILLSVSDDLLIQAQAEEFLNNKETTHVKKLSLFNRLH